MEPIISETLECPKCKNIFNDPVLLSCDHSFCFNCISQSISKEEESIPCFICHQITKNIQINSTLSQIIHEMKKNNLITQQQQIQKCVCGELGYKYCENCQFVICQ